ncbi:hypothetical protein MTP99_002865 [Tenebrio molitor]|jgi:hypothetical protein|uniref:ankyrin repeat domain-containing protein 27-like n=1 Tax=Tenebrio molitor TaxID=7067 RepID=UPI00270B1AF5|nr:hypothetical protein MTP99_002865 [Tenebrio molitor]
MDIKDLKQAENLLIKLTQNDNIKNIIDSEIETWDFPDIDNYAELVSRIHELFNNFHNEDFQNDQNTVNEALDWILFHKIHDILLPNIKMKFSDEDKNFFEKCKFFSDVQVSAEQFGADENYSIPLCAAVVELSVLDNYKSPAEKINCLCSTYDLVFAEIKTAMVSVISQNSEKDNEIPIIDNRDIIPVLMVVIIRSKLVHIFSNLFYIKMFYNKLEENRIVSDIFKSFETATNRLMEIDVKNLQPITGKIIKSIDLEQYIKITTCVQEENVNKTLVDEENQRVLKLINQSTSEDELH